MTNLAVTCENLEFFSALKNAGVQEIQLAYTNSCFSACHEFSKEEICSLLAKEDISISIQMNALFHEEEIKTKQKDLETFIKHGAKYIIVSDLGLLQYAKEKGLLKYILYDPQFLITSTMEAKTFLDLGVGRIAISPCLTKEEIHEIIKECKNTSMVIHGHLLMSVSKRKLLTAYGKQYNLLVKRNKKYELQEEKRDALMPTVEKERGMMIYTDFVQESFAEVEEFINDGLERLEIHSEFLDENMVLDAISLYQKIISEGYNKQWEDEYRHVYSNCPLADGYYEQATIK